jgi:hypothetical protein
MDVPRRPSKPVGRNKNVGVCKERVEAAGLSIGKRRIIEPEEISQLIRRLSDQQRASISICTKMFPQEISAMLKSSVRILIVVVIGLIAGVIGWVIGALIGGNYAEQLVFNGVRGYEATGQIGFLLGTLIGLTSSWKLLIKREA